MVHLDPHPCSEPYVLEVRFQGPIGAHPSPPHIVAALSLDAEAPLTPDESVRLKVRDLLRHGGFKPSGRSKPASEYLLKASEKGTLTSINLPVDLCNVVSLHAGLPVSVVDLERAEAPLQIGLADAEASYVFNASGQEIDIGGLLCLHDAQGPCANAVKDSQRTKTHEGSSRCLYVIWGTRDLPGRAREAAAWLSALLEGEGAEVQMRIGSGAPVEDQSS